MSIFKIKHISKYFALSNAVITDPRISFKAKGILAYLLSKPDDWKVYQSDIVKQSTDGEFSVRKGVDELIAAGYIVRRSIRDEKGRISEWEYSVSECPDCGFPHVDNPVVENRTLLSTDVTKNGINQVRNNDNGSSLCDDRDISVYESEYENHSSIAVDFYRWYVAKCYPHYKKVEHPRLKKPQRDRVLDALDNFISDTGIDISGLGDMANQYFKTVKDCDHNINHFATEGIMQNRFYEVAY